MTRSLRQAGQGGAAALASRSIFSYRVPHSSHWNSNIGIWLAPDRFCPHHSTSRCSFARSAFGPHLAEDHSGYLSYNRRAIETIPYQRLSNSFDFDLEMLVLARVKGLRVKEIPTATIYAGEKSHLNPITYGFDDLRVVRDYKRGGYDRL